MQKFISSYTISKTNVYTDRDTNDDRDTGNINDDRDTGTQLQRGRRGAQGDI